MRKYSLNSYYVTSATAHLCLWLKKANRPSGRCARQAPAAGTRGTARRQPKGTCRDDALQVFRGCSAGGGHGGECSGMSALVFSSRDFQYGLQQISPSTNGLISFAQLDAADRQIQQLESRKRWPARRAARNRSADRVRSIRKCKALKPARTKRAPRWSARSPTSKRAPIFKPPRAPPPI
jgi:hypothetical protein